MKSKAARFTGLLVALPAGLYALLMNAGWLPAGDRFSVTALVGICLSLLVLGLVQLFQRSLATGVFGLYLGLYHLLLALMFCYVTGFAVPVVVLWIILSFTAAVYLGQTAFLASLAGLATAGLYASSLSPSLGYRELALSMATAAFVAVTGYVISRGVISTAADERRQVVRSRHRDAAEKQRFLTLINSMGEAVVSVTTTGVIQMYNAATLNLLDTNQSIAGRKFDDVFRLYEGHHRFQLIDHLAAERRAIARDDLQHTYNDDEQLRLYVSASPIRGFTVSGRERLEGFILVLRDITREKSLEEERDEFISVVSHELRTPLTIAEGTLSNLGLLMRKKLPPAQMSAHLEAAHQQVVYLATMVNDLGTLSRAERGVADTPEPIDVDALLHELYKQYAPRATAKGLQLDLSLSGRVGTVLASRLYLEEVLQNFLTNAIKYTASGSVMLAASVEAGQVCFAVTDTGIGISKTDQAKVFDKFYRSEDYRTRETSGTGLGLYVVRKLAHKLGTAIELTSRLNYGSTFSFRLPQGKNLGSRK